MKAIINSQRVHWYEHGRGEPVLFVHGFPFHGGMWAGQWSSLPGGWRGVAPDLRGFGQSADHTAGPFTMEQFADDLAALLDHLQLRQAVICGLSMGGYIAFAFYRRHAARVRSLVLCNTRAGADSEEARQNRRTLAARVRAEGVRAAVDSMLPRLISESTRRERPDVLAEVEQLMMANQPETVARTMEGLALRADSQPLLASIDVPTLVVHGTDDAIIPPEEGEKLASSMRGARLELLSDIGHLSNLENAPEFNRILTGFLAHL